MSARPGLGGMGENRPALGSRTVTRNLSNSGDRNDGNAMMSDEIRSEVRRIVPTLTDERYKGQSGKIAVLGGCYEYAGAPYFSAFAALVVGADLSHVFCSSSAAPTIKQYSPDLLVHPYFMQRADLLQQLKLQPPVQASPSSHLTQGEASQTPSGAQAAVAAQAAAAAAHVAEATAEVEGWFNRLDCLVVGPGLGRDPLLLDIARSVILRARAAKMPLVLDGDGLFLVAREPELVAGYTNCVLTPNLNEFRRLASTLGVSLHGPNNDRSSKLLEVTAHLRGPTLVSKGPVDAICDGKVTMICNASGGAKRCGSQGDILAGTIATFIAWTLAFLDSARQSAEEVVILPEINPMVLASYGACLVTRTAAAYAFASRKRAMLASDMLNQLGSAMEMLFDTAGGTGAGGGGTGSAGAAPQGQGLLQAHMAAPAAPVGVGVGGAGGGA